MLPTVSLYDHVGLGVIIAHPTGVAYSNQTGGTSCLHPELEGAFVPLRNDYLVPSHAFQSPELALYAYFEGAKWRGSGATRGIDSEDADFIDQLLSQHRLAHCIRVDRSRLSDSHEAWIHIEVLADEGLDAPVLSGFAPYPRNGVLTWQNSD